MKITLKDESGAAESREVSSLVITLSSGETIEIGEESQNRPSHLAEGVTVWGAVCQKKERRWKNSKRQRACWVSIPWQPT
ncbi:hypothetical protein [Type-D symbiont of Plautia stali]|uniref:hypothetical protein n=1 Tax=Type-D symbiont of Plautia stali TaxID=1560356 RepID=UPI001F3B7514|nr:hypothetical protein [Type-D symbiont of Plautia stali]